MLRLLFIVLILQLYGCSTGQNKIESEEIVHERFVKKYDSLRTSLKDSLHSTIQNVNDFGGLFTATEKIQIDSLLSDFKKQSGLRMVVITFDSTMTSKDSVIEVTDIVGIKNRINTTIGIANSYKFMHIWNDSLLNRSLISQSTTKEIIDSFFIPSFKKGEYFEGTIQGIDELKKRIMGMLKYKKFTKENGS
jgi:uncharacterized protein